MSEFLVEAAGHSAAIAASLHKLRQRAESAIRDAAIADTVLDARDVPAGPSGDTPHPRERPISAPLDATRTWGSDLLRDVQAPDVLTVNPLGELESLALRSAQALRSHTSRLRQLGLVLAALAAAALGAGLYTAVQGEIGLAGGLIGGGLVVPSLFFLKSNPFRRAARSAELAELADATATTLRLRMRALSELSDTKSRTLEAWKVVLEMTAAVRR